MTFLANATIIAGHDVVEQMRANRTKARRSPHMPDCFDSESLCEMQRLEARQGILGAVIESTFYGYSVRYDSGLQDFGLLAGSRSGMLDGTYQDAVRWARAWQASDPTRRYVWVRPKP